MPIRGRLGAGALLLLIVMVLAAGCASGVCKNRLYIFREAPEKSPPAAAALVITDPRLAAALVPEAAGRVSKGPQWALEQPFYSTDAYRLSLAKVDGRAVYQGTCMDTQVTDVCEVRPGSRRLSFKTSLYGPWGQRSVIQEMGSDLKAGTVYFFGITWTGGREGDVRVTAEALGTYSAEFRQRLLEWQRAHTVGRSLD